MNEENHHLGHAPAVAWQICSEFSEELAVSITLMMEAAVPLHCWYISYTLHSYTTRNMVFFTAKCSDNLTFMLLHETLV
jgi:hypothetical protein